jgi:hypothetical protein
MGCRMPRWKQQDSERQKTEELKRVREMIVNRESPLLEDNRECSIILGEDASLGKSC